MGIWGGGWYFVKPGGTFEIRGQLPDPLLDVTQSSRYAPYLIMYIAYAFYDGAYQSYAYWLMGALSNDSAKLARYSGWYKSIQSAAAAVVWRLDGLRTPYRTMYLSTWIFLSVACVTTTYVGFWRVRDSSDEREVEEGRVTDGVDPEIEGMETGESVAQVGKGELEGRL
ncbi:UNC93-like protein [Lasiodiplodia hormozganensis]|uniref:UNC93-like protein n=1 Tax=Lasiodiplodia hormozganensis TaxID=869390 RepID=A0AA39U166_9PEZI|nr:UNC93-like protein [Lasiodiplodia hormozganensis]